MGPGGRPQRSCHARGWHINPLLEAVAEATEEAITNALLAAETMTGRDGITAHALDHERVREVMRAHGR